MSVSRTCVFAETAPDKWYLLLAAREYGDLDDEYATCDGPFKTEDEADQYLRDNYSNPGSSSTWGPEDLTPRMKELIARARKPQKSARWF